MSSSQKRKADSSDEACQNLKKRIQDMLAKNKASSDVNEGAKSSADNPDEKEEVLEPMEDDELYTNRRHWLEQKVDAEGKPMHFWNLELKIWRPEFAEFRLYSPSKSKHEMFELKECVQGDPENVQKILDLVKGCPQSEYYLSFCFDKAFEFKCYIEAEGILRIWLHQVDPFDENMIRLRSRLKRTFYDDRRLTLLEYVDELDERKLNKIDKLFEIYSQNRPKSSEEELLKAGKTQPMTQQQQEEKEKEKEHINVEIYNTLAIEGGTLTLEEIRKLNSQNRPKSCEITEELLEAGKTRPMTQQQQEEKEKEKEHTNVEIYNTLAIEGGTLTLEEVRKLNEGEVKTLPGHSEEEIGAVIGMREAIEYLNKLIASNEKMDFEHLCKVHGHVLKGIDEKEPGKFRTSDVFIRNVPFVPCPHSKVEAEMNKVLDFMHNRPEGMRPIEYAALLHFIFVYVHPYRDGNGRVGRLLLNFELRKMNYPPIIVPLQLRPEYMQSLYLGDMGDLRRLIRFFALIMEKTLQNWIEKGKFSTLEWDTPSGYTLCLEES